MRPHDAVAIASRCEKPMAFVTEFVEEGRGLTFTGSGHLTGAEILASKRELTAEMAQHPPVSWSLISLEAVTSATITREDIDAITRLDLRIAQWAPDAVVAVVAPRDHDFGMARMWETVAEATGWRRGVFRDRVEAEAWLRATVGERLAH